MPTCLISGILKRVDETPMPDQVVQATIQSRSDDQGGQLVGVAGIVSDPVEAYSDLDGTFEINLLQGAIVLLEIPSICLSKLVLVPTVATAKLEDLI